MKIKQLGIVSGVALATLVTASTVQAAIVVVPPSLAPGAQYRLVFVTDGTRNATSTDINDYNTFVTNDVTPTSALAIALNAAGLTTTWKAIGSTSATSAKVNTGTDGSQPDVAIYLIDGNKVANNNADLWDGTILTPINRTQSDQPTFEYGVPIWTGSASDGTTTSNPLGSSDLVNAGSTFYSSSNWVSDGPFGNATLLKLYGMSSVLTVPTPAVSVPEPSSLLGLITLGGLMLGGAVRLTGGGSDT